MMTKCPQCHSTNPSGAQVCKQCGALLSLPDGVTVAPTASLPSLPQEMEAGTILNSKYRVLEKIGSGGMGVVYKAEDIRLKRIVALKFLTPVLTGKWEAQERFGHEAQAASELDHPNICTVYEFAETEGGQMYIAMAFYSGESLKEKIRRGPFAAQEAVEIAIQLATGLGKAHQRGIVHRDIKPGNILMTEDGLVKIVDFGLARLTGSTRVTRPGTTIGTLAYMSPEQVQGYEVDHRTDLWSLGVVLYEMLSGRLPFQGEHEASLLYSIVHEPPRRLKSLKPDVPAELDRIVQRALEKKPESRYSSAEEMLKDLKLYQESLRISETAQPALRLLLRKARTPRIAVSTAAVLMVLIVGGILFYRHQARVRWAREVALPEIERLAADVLGDFTEAYALAEKAEKYIPDDPRLSELISRCSLPISIRTEPPGAKIYMKAYKTPDAEWKYLGVSPLEKIRLPIGVFRWKLAKEGYETVFAASSTWDIDVASPKILKPSSLVRALDKKGNIPPGMVRVTGAQTNLGRIDDFYIDKYEVTNKEYKKFINAGGYKDRKYWKQKFIRDGKELRWEDATGEFVDQTGQPGPATWQAGDFPEGQGNYPVSGISWYEAAAYADYAGKSLPTGTHWGIARGEYTPMILWPQLGGFAIFLPFSNFFKAEGPVPAGSLPGITSYGVFDMAGNVREWCWNETAKGRLIRGGAWDDNTYMFEIMSQAPPMDRSAKNGFRCAFYPESATIPEAAFETVKLAELRNYYKEKPVPDSVFEVYKEQFSYDKTDLNARVESRHENPGGWIQEKITFDAAYGGERVIAYLFLPKNATPPFQAVIYWPGSAAVFQRSSNNIESYYEYTLFLSFLVKSGRAVLFPVYKATFERGNADLAVFHMNEEWNNRRYTELLIQEVKDLKRCIDYLETRRDIDSRKLAFEGMSWGAIYGAIIPAVEERIKVNVILAGGFMESGRPEVNQINYVTRVKIPTLMLNGKYDVYYTVDNSSKPMFDLLGTPPEQKHMKLYETDHIPPINEMIKETLAFLDRYLGPVR